MAKTLSDTKGSDQLAPSLRLREGSPAHDHSASLAQPCQRVEAFGRGPLVTIHVCFKCGCPFEPELWYPIYKTHHKRTHGDAPSFCRGCREGQPANDANQTFPCGCTDTSAPSPPWPHKIPWAPPRHDCVGCHGTGRIRDRHRYLKIKRNIGVTAREGERGGVADRQLHYHETFREDERTDGEALDFLGRGGWFVVDTTKAATGKPPGRPTKGLTDEDKISLVLALALVPYQGLLQDLAVGRIRIRDALGLVLLDNPTLDRWINKTALSGLLRRSRREPYRMKKRAEELLSQNLPKGGYMQTEAPPTIVERLTALETAFSQQKDLIRETARQVGIDPDDERLSDEAIRQFFAENTTRNFARDWPS
jgi:hypothetical protein